MFNKLHIQCDSVIIYLVFCRQLGCIFYKKYHIKHMYYLCENLFVMRLQILSDSVASHLQFFRRYVLPYSSIFILSHLPQAKSHSIFFWCNVFVTFFHVPYFDQYSFITNFNVQALTNRFSFQGQPSKLCFLSAPCKFDLQWNPNQGLLCGRQSIFVPYKI